MTTIPASKTLNVRKPTRNWQAFTAFVLEKIGENVLDMVITIASLGILLAYLLISVPEMAIAYGGYITLIYLLVLILRIVHDFDESYTLDELGKRLDLMLEYQRAIHDRVRDEGELDDSEMERRLRETLM